MPSMEMGAVFYDKFVIVYYSCTHPPDSDGLAIRNAVQFFKCADLYSR